MLEVCSLSFDYDDKLLLNDICFAVSEGTLLHLRGDNGAGKTTLLKLLAGILKPMQGDVRWKNNTIYQNLSSYQQTLCYVGHKLGISSQLSVKENCLLDLHWQKPPSSFEPLLEEFSLLGLQDKLCFQLSAGQLRRVALLRLALCDAQIWLLDEPLVALDSHALASLAFYFKKHLNQGGLIIMTSHQALPAVFNQSQEYKLC